MRIDDRDRARRQDLRRHVMIRYDKINIFRHRIHQRRRTDPAVDSNEHTVPFAAQPADSILIQAVAFAVPAGNIKAGLYAHSPKEAIQNRCGRNPIHIIIPVNHDFFFIFYRGKNA